MPLMDTGYNSRPISVPPRLPIILKQFCKAAIKTQPYDLLKWSSAYFRALSQGIEPPTKIRLEYPLPGSVSGLTLGFIKVLLRQFGDYNKIFSIESIIQRWDDLCLDRRDFNLIMAVGKFRHNKCQIKKFLAIAVGLLGASLYDTMLMICELFTLEPDGGSAMIPVGLFMEIYSYLAGLECNGGGEKKSPISNQDDEAENYLPTTSDSSTEPITPQATCDNFNDKIKQDIEPDDNPSPNNQVECFTSDTTENKQIDSSNEILENKSEYHHHLGNFENQLNQSVDDVKKIDDNSDGEIDSVLYPNIPGIGPRLSSEEIAAVAVWIKECARLQDGMVGPRNLRHFQCPPLDRHDTPYS